MLDAVQNHSARVVVIGPGSSSCKDDRKPRCNAHRDCPWYTEPLLSMELKVATLKDHSVHGTQGVMLIANQGVRAHRTEHSLLLLLLLVLLLLC